MRFSTDYLYCFHYSGGIGYLIFCCHSVAAIIWIYMAYMVYSFEVEWNLDRFQLYLKYAGKSVAFYVFHI